MKKLWLVIFTSRVDWDSPTVVAVMAHGRDEALRKAVDKQGISPAEFEEKYSGATLSTDSELDYDKCVIEADEIIE